MTRPTMAVTNPTAAAAAAAAAALIYQARLASRHTIMAMEMPMTATIIVLIVLIVLVLVELRPRGQMFSENFTYSIYILCLFIISYSRFM